jgi:hypothetical protein
MFHSPTIDGYEEAVKEGKSYSTDQICRRMEGNATLTPPYERLLIACVLHPVVASPKYYRKTGGLVELSTWVVATVLTLWIQLQMLYCLDNELGRKDTDQLASCALIAREHGRPEGLLCIASNAALIVAVLSEMKGLLSLYDWINRLPSANNEDLGVLNDLHCGFAVRKRVFKLGEQAPSGTIEPDLYKY